MSSGRPGDVPDDIIADLIDVLELVILERLPGGAMVRVGDRPAPSWFAETFYQENMQQAVTLLEAFPVLDGILSQADLFWEQTVNGRLDGETCVITGKGGQNLALGVVAVAINGRRFLLMQRLPGIDDRQRILQLARDQALEYERVVKRIDLLRGPFTTLNHIVGELAAMEIAEPQRQRLTSISRELDTLRELLDRLPQMPKGASARRPLG
jgi:hypothetical protein